VVPPLNWNPTLSMAEVFRIWFPPCLPELVYCVMVLKSIEICCHPVPAVVMVVLA